MPEAFTGTMATDEALVLLAREGDRAATEELFRRHWSAAHRVAYRLLGHDQDAQDATQECMIKALSHLNDFDGRSGFRTWLLRIVTNAASTRVDGVNEGRRSAWGRTRARVSINTSPPWTTTQPWP